MCPLVLAIGNSSFDKYCKLPDRIVKRKHYAIFSFSSRAMQSHNAVYPVPLLEWPVASPDIHPIENVSQILKDRVEKLQTKQMTGEQELWKHG